MKTAVADAGYVAADKHAAERLTSTLTADRTGGVVAWGVWGVIWIAIAVNAWLRWIASDTLFGPAPIMPGDTIEPGRLGALRVLEVVSTLVVLQCAWQCALKPWLRERKFGLDGMLLLGGIVGFSADSLLNLHELLFAFNAHSVNLGVWTSFMPFYTTGPAHYAESLLWGFPMYVYFGITASLAGCAIVSSLRRRYPGISNAAALAIAYVTFVVADFVLENTIIRLTDAYMYTKTYAPLTVFAGSIYQFPFYESLFSAGVSLGFTLIRLSAMDHPEGLSL
ncbi:MAG: spirocyclase AveC family protein, partial [Steroidobacteraceae bacterium]